MDPLAKAEQKKYEKVFNAHPDRYGIAVHGRPSFPWVSSHGKAPVYDFGCGRNHYIRELKEKWNTTGLGIDIACQEADVIAPMWEVPLPSHSAAVLTAFDSLEHLPPERVEATFLEMSRLAQPGAPFCFSIESRPHRCKRTHQVLHLSPHPLSWWRDVLSPYANVHRRSRVRGRKFLTGNFL